MFLDHIVHHVTTKPKEAVQQWNEKGFHAVIGGQHIQWGTYNALLYTKTSYIEWLALEHEDVAINANHPLVNLLLHDLKTGPGFGTVCIRTNTMDELCEQLEQKGIETSGVLHAERKTTSGSVRKWKMLFVKEQVGDALPTPFFIEWEESDEERYRLLEKDGTINASNLDLSIAACEFHVDNPREVMDRWKNYFGFEEQDEQTLLLSNARFIFKKKINETKERLATIYVNGSEKNEDIHYENANYRFLAK